MSENNFSLNSDDDSYCSVNPKGYTIDEAVLRLKVSKQVIYDLVKEKKLTLSEMKLFDIDKFLKNIPKPDQLSEEKQGFFIIEDDRVGQLIIRSKL